MDGVNALVVDPLNESECFRRIDDLLHTPERIQAMKMEGLITASRYSIHSAVISELAVFSKTLRGFRVERSHTDAVAIGSL